MPGLFEQFPHTNFHELNLDWMIDLLNQFKQELKDRAVISVNGMTGEVVLYESENVVLPPLTDVSSWRLVRMMDGQYVGVLFQDGHVWLQQGNSTLKLLTTEDIPTSAGVVSINGLGGIVRLTGADIPIDDSADPDSIRLALETEHTERVNTDNILQLAINNIENSLNWTRILDSYPFTAPGNVEIPSIDEYKELLVIVDTRKSADNNPFGYCNSLTFPAFLHGANSITFAIPLVVGNFVKFLFSGTTLYVTELGTLPANANAFLITIYAR